MPRYLALALPLLIPACGSYEPMQASCLNSHVSPNYGTVTAIPGGFEIAGSGVAYTTIEITQVVPDLKPAPDARAPDDFARPSMRTFECKAL